MNHFRIFGNPIRIARKSGVCKIPVIRVIQLSEIFDQIQCMDMIYDMIYPPGSVLEQIAAVARDVGFTLICTNLQSMKVYFHQEHLPFDTFFTPF